MSSAIAIITYNRVQALKTMLDGMLKHCSQYPLAIFDDCSQRDGTEAFLTNGQPAITQHDDIDCAEYSGKHIGPNVQVFCGRNRYGVSGQSNRAIRWFEKGGWDHLCLCNDDLHVFGDFVEFYARGHRDLEVGLWCFCDFTGESYRWVTVHSRGYQVKLLPRLTGIMMSFTRQVVEKVGYFDARYGMFGNEHCDITYRARFEGFVKLDGMDQNGLDLEHDLLKHQEVETSVQGMERQRADMEAEECMREAARRYKTDPHYRPFALRLPRFAGVNKPQGVPVEHVKGYALLEQEREPQETL